MAELKYLLVLAVLFAAERKSIGSKSGHSGHVPVIVMQHSKCLVTHGRSRQHLLSAHYQSPIANRPPARSTYPLLQDFFPAREGSHRSVATHTSLKVWHECVSNDYCVQASRWRRVPPLTDTCVRWDQQQRTAVQQASEAKHTFDGRYLVLFSASGSLEVPPRPVAQDHFQH